MRLPSAREGEERMECVDVRQETCPFLVPVLADQLWIYPRPAYCRRLAARIRVPAPGSLARFCMSDYAACAGYRASTEAERAPSRL